MARRYMKEYAGKVPLILKINGKTNIPSDAEALSSPTATVEDAVALGADAVGYTLYVGSPRQDEDFQRLRQVRDDCEKYGMPLVVWAYPRGAAMEAKGGRNSLYAVDYAARLAHEFGADIIKLNVPKKSDKDHLMPEPYQQIEWDYAEGARRVTASAGNSMVLFSGGSKVSDEDLMTKARTVMEGGATGLIFGRNMWQRPYDEALDMSARMKELLQNFPS
jgi:class I fructose-bisphosphate aldolase